MSFGHTLLRTWHSSGAAHAASAARLQPLHLPRSPKAASASGSRSCVPPIPRLQLSGGPGTGWRSVGRMPRRRVMGDALILCDGTVGLFNGAEQGIAVGLAFALCCAAGCG